MAYILPRRTEQILSTDYPLATATSSLPKDWGCGLLSLPGSVWTHVPLGTVAWDRETLLTSYSSVWLLEWGHGISLTQTHGLRVAGQIGYLEEAGILL